MKASIMDLRYKIRDVLKALRRNEEVHVFYHDKEVGVIIPPKMKKSKLSVMDHPLFGSCKGDKETVEEKMNRLRAPRHS